MTSRRVRCMFCYLETEDAIKPSFEHLLSRPVADAFGIERDSDVARGGGDLSEVRVSKLSGIKRKCVCTRCNNGWMNVLEHGMGAVAGWLDAPVDQQLGAQRDLSLRKWALKTHFLLHFIDGDAANFLQRPNSAVVPPLSDARRLFEGDDDFITRSAYVGVSTADTDGAFAWAFGHPRLVNPPAPGVASFVPVSVGRLRLWVATPQVFVPQSIEAPAGVVASSARLRRPQLGRVPGLPSAESMALRFPRG